MQIKFAYNSSHIEGSSLSEEVTKNILETKTLIKSDYLKIDDLLLTLHHFKAFDYIIDTAGEELNEEYIKHLHYILFHDTELSSLTWFNTGDYKKIEKIHPFQDGNRRVGRLISFKECLKNDNVPFLIEDQKKGFYYRGLSEWKNDKTFLIETCLDGQETIKNMLRFFKIKF